MKTILFITTALFILNSFASADEFVDDFAAAKFEGRLAERGEWKFAGGIASCVADPVLYKQFKNHGPVLKWRQEFNDASIQFEMKPTDGQRVVFTLNGDGPIFRVTLADETPEAPAGTSKVPTRIIAWATESTKDNKGDSIAPKGLPDLPAVNKQWVKVKLVVKNDHANLHIGDFQTEIKHAALARDKNMVMLTFAHGELAVRNFRMTSEKRQEVPRDRSSQRVQPEQTKAPYGYFIQKNIAVDSKGEVPLVISLHGAGGGKKGVDGMPVGGEKYFAASKHSYVFVKPTSKKGWDPDQVDQCIDTMLEEYKGIVDPKRIYLYGYSMGGYGAWRYCIDHGDRIAAMMAIEGGFIRSTGPITKYDFKHFKDLPVWAFHNRDDHVVPLEKGQEPVDAARAAGGSPRFTIHESGEHKMQLEKNLNKEVIDCLFSQSR